MLVQEVQAVSSGKQCMQFMEISSNPSQSPIPPQAYYIRPITVVPCLQQPHHILPPGFQPQPSAPDYGAPIYAVPVHPPCCGCGLHPQPVYPNEGFGHNSHSQPGYSIEGFGQNPYSQPGYSIEDKRLLVGRVERYLAEKKNVAEKKKTR